MGAYPKVGLLCCFFTVTFTTAICPIPYRHICILRKHIFYYTISLYKQTSYIYVVFGTRYEILLYSSLYSIYTQLCSTILAYCTVRRQICTLSTLVLYSIYTQEFTYYLYIHLKYITVHRTFSDTTVQLYNTIAVPYAYY